MKMRSGNEKAEITQLIFNTNDSSLAVSGSNGYLGRWTLPTYEVIQETQPQDQLMSFQSIDFMHEDNEADKHVVLLAGSQRDPGGPQGMDTLKIARVVDSRDVTRLDLYADGLEELQALGKYTQVKFVAMNQRTFAILAATDSGNVNIYNHYAKEKTIEQISAHHGQVACMCVSPDGARLFTAGEDGALFVYKISERAPSAKGDTLAKTFSSFDESAVQREAGGAAGDKKNAGGKGATKMKIMEPELADIVLVKRNEMAEWQQRYKQLKYDLALTKKKVEMKLAECKKRF